MNPTVQLLEALAKTESQMGNLPFDMQYLLKTLAAEFNRNQFQVVPQHNWELSVGPNMVDALQCAGVVLTAIPCTQNFD